MVWLLIVKLGAVLSTYMAKLAVTSLKLKTGLQHILRIFRHLCARVRIIPSYREHRQLDM